MQLMQHPLQQEHHSQTARVCSATLFWFSAQIAHRGALQHTATLFNTLQHSATHCSKNLATSSSTRTPLSNSASMLRDPLLVLCTTSTLRRTATHCNALRHTATHYISLQHTAARPLTLCWFSSEPALCGTLQRSVTHCNTLQHTATHCSTLQHTATHCNTLQHTATHCSTLQHAATRSLSLSWVFPPLCASLSIYP